jgi:activator of HSP90 ATPase
LTTKSPKLKTGTIRQKILIPNATPEQVYKAFLTSKIHSDFTGSPATVNARKGAKFSAWDGYITGRNISLLKDKEIVQDWRTTEFPEGYDFSILKLTLKKKGDGTELNMVQTKVPDSQVNKYDEGWHSSYWDPMKEYFQKK